MIGATVTSALFVNNLLPSSSRQNTVRYATTAALRSTMLLASHFLPASVLHHESLRKAAGLRQHHLCFNTSTTADSHCALFESSQESVNALSIHDVLVSSHVLREMQALDELEFGYLLASQSPRLTQPLQRPGNFTSRTSLGAQEFESALSLWSKLCTALALQARSWGRPESVQSWPLASSSVAQVEQDMRSAELRLRQYWGRDIQSRYMVGTFGFLAVGMVMAAGVATTIAWFGWRVSKTRKWTYTALTTISQRDASEIHEGVSLLYDSIVYSAGGHAGAAEGDEADPDDSGDDESHVLLLQSASRRSLLSDAVSLHHNEDSREVSASDSRGQRVRVQGRARKGGSVLGRRAGSVLSGAQSVATRGHSGLDASTIMGTATMNMTVFRQLHVRQRVGQGQAPITAASGRIRAQRQLRESWRHARSVLVLVSILTMVALSNVAVTLGMSAWHQASVLNSESRLFLIQRSGANLKSMSSTLMSTVSSGGKSTNASTAVQTIEDGVYLVRDTLRALAEGGDVPYLEHATLAGSSNFTAAVDHSSYTGRIMYDNACSADVLGFDSSKQMRRSSLAASTEAPLSISTAVLQASPAYKWHAAHCMSVEDGVLTQGLQLGVSLYLSLAGAAANHLAATAANMSTSCPASSMGTDLSAAYNSSTVSAAQHTACKQLASLVARLVHLETLHLSPALQLAGSMEFVHGVNIHTQWTTLIIVYSLLLPFMNLSVVFGITLPLFQALLYGVVADRLLLTTLPERLRQQPLLKQRIQPVLDHILQQQHV